MDNFVSTPKLTFKNTMLIKKDCNKKQPAVWVLKKGCYHRDLNDITQVLIKKQKIAKNFNKSIYFMSSLTIFSKFQLFFEEHVL